MKKEKVELPEKPICLQRDEVYHTRTQTNIENQKRKWQKFADEFKALDLGELELLTLYAATEQVALELWKQRQTVPAGFDANKYYDMLVKPDLTHLIKARDYLQQLHPDLFFVENWEVKVNESIAEMLKAANDVIISKPDQENYNKLLKLKDLLSEFGMLKGESGTGVILSINFNPTGLRMNQHSGEYEFDLPAMKNFLKTLNK